ncbi:hypothetical protein RvY_10204-2 [Ramazzottius varieornatus]|uniref:Uncharacterized protein n=1 Tax=Ramazzottius varieornatus TaxID=947166 RepID=A0A1D1VHC6_RAMVA|nr:hypothetical protein RvY_10204-2 [Ramazzottius varieornatus]
MALPASFGFLTVLVFVLLVERFASAAPRSLADPRFFLGRAGASAKHPAVTRPTNAVESPFDMPVSKIGQPGSSEFFVPRNNWFFAPRSLPQSDDLMLDEPEPLYYKRMGSSGIGFDGM